MSWMARSHLLFLSTLSLRRATRNHRFRSWPIPHFYPRSPCGERRYSLRHSAQGRYFYPRSPCGERQYLVRGQRPSWGISIHALLAESDDRLRRAYHGRGISIHALLAESDLKQKLFCLASNYFYPRSPCGERPGGYGCAYLYLIISIHALLAESDGFCRITPEK